MRIRHIEPEDRERGAGAVQTLGYFFVLAIVFFALIAAGAMMQAKHRAQTGADLGAIAGAQSVDKGRSIDEACRHAGRIAQENKASIMSCYVEGESVTVTVESQPSLPALPRVHAKAVAAPEEY